MFLNLYRKRVLPAVSRVPRWKPRRRKGTFWPFGATNEPVDACGGSSYISSVLEVKEAGGSAFDQGCSIKAEVGQGVCSFHA